MRVKNHSINDKVDMAHGLVLMATELLNTTGELHSYELDRAVDKLNIAHELLNQARDKINESQGML